MPFVGVRLGIPGSYLGGGSATAPPVLNDNFVTGFYFPGPAASNDLVVTRSTTKTVTDASGNLSTVAINALPISNAGLSLEPASTNSLLWSSDLTNATWGLTTTTSAKNLTGPDQVSNSATTLTFAAGTSSIKQEPFNIASGATLSFYFKPLTSRFLYFLAKDGATAAVATWFDLQLGTVLTQNTIIVGTPLIRIAAPTIKIFLNGWIRITWNSINASMEGVAWGVSDADATRTLSATKTLGAYGPQAEPGLVATSYIPTTNASVTRAADSVTVQHTGIGNFVFSLNDGSTQVLYLDPTRSFIIPPVFAERLITQIVGYAATASLRQAVATTYFPDQANTFAQAGARQTMVARTWITSIQIAIPNSFGLNEALSGGTLTATASYQDAVNGTIVPLTFSGSSSGSTAGALLWSDEVVVPPTPPGTLITVRLWGSNSNNKFMIGDNFLQANGGVAQFGATVTDTTVSGGALTNTTPNAMWGICALVTRHNGKAVGVVGDSIGYGVVNGAPDQGNLLAQSIAQTLPVMNFALPGDDSVLFLANSTIRRSLINGYCTSSCTNMGYNDLGAGRSGATIIANRATMASLLPHMLQSTITPSGTSTDDFATPGNQTPTHNPDRVIVNTNVRSLPNYLEVTIPLEFGLNSGIWRSVGDGSVIAQVTTSSGAWNGIHPLTYGYGLVKVYGGVNPTLFT